MELIAVFLKSEKSDRNFQLVYLKKQNQLVRVRVELKTLVLSAPLSAN